MRNKLAIAIMALAAALLQGCGGGESGQARAASAPATIELADFSPDPSMPGYAVTMLSANFKVLRNVSTTITFLPTDFDVTHPLTKKGATFTP